MVSIDLGLQCFIHDARCQKLGRDGIREECAQSYKTLQCSSVTPNHSSGHGLTPLKDLRVRMSKRSLFQDRPLYTCYTIRIGRRAKGYG